MYKLFLLLVDHPDIARDVYIPCSVLGALGVDDDCANALAFANEFCGGPTIAPNLKS